MFMLRACAMLCVAMALLLAGCSQQSDLVSPTETEQSQSGHSGTVKGRPSMTLSMPEGATLLTAYFCINVVDPSNRETRIYRVTDSWEEMTVTYNSFGGAYNPTIRGSYTAVSPGWWCEDVKSLVNEWLQGTSPNHGLLVAQDIPWPQTKFDSRETGANAPYLEVCYSVPEGVVCEEITAEADAFIDGYRPDENFGDLDSLLTGQDIVNCFTKYLTLIKFDLEGGPSPRLASIGDRVWYDSNQNGIQDGGEAGVPGVAVSLYTCQDVFVASQNTNAIGEYLFDGLLPGDYYVVFTLPAGYLFSPRDQGDDDAQDSDADPTTGRTVCTKLDEGEADMTWDAGIYEEPVEYGECDGKVTQLTLRYNGSIVNAHIVVKQHKGEVVFDGIVQPGGQFTFYGMDRHGTFGPETYYWVNDVYNTNIHTSCSQPIGPGLTKGDFTVIEGYSRHGGLLPPL